MNDNNSIIPEGLRKSMDVTQKVSDCVKPIIEQHDKINVITNANNVPLSTVQINPAVKTISENMSNKLNRNLGKIAVSTNIPDFKFTSSALESLKPMSINVVSNLSSALTTFVNSEAIKMSKTAKSVIGNWLHNIDFSPLKGLTDALCDLISIVSPFLEENSSRLSLKAYAIFTRCPTPLYT